MVLGQRKAASVGDLSFVHAPSMSVLGTKRTYQANRRMSAFGGEADMGEMVVDVGLVPIAAFASSLIVSDLTGVA